MVVGRGDRWVRRAERTGGGRCTRPRAWWRGLAIALAAGAGIALAGPGTGPAAAGPLDSVRYEIRTRSSAHPGACGAEVRTTAATIGIPRFVDVAGDLLPDAIVTLIALPSTSATAPFVQLDVVALRPLHASVEVVVAPSASSAERIAFGYDGCEEGIPGSFMAQVAGTPDRIGVLAAAGPAATALTLTGSTYQADGSRRVDPLEVRARLDPVPALSTLDVSSQAGGVQEATLRTNIPVDLGLELRDRQGQASTTASAEIPRFPGRLEARIEPSAVEYGLHSTMIDGLEAPLDRVDLRVRTVPAQDPSEPGIERTTELDATLRQVPSTGRLEQVSDTRVRFDAPSGPIGSTTVDFASYEPGEALPRLQPLDDEYLVAEVTPAASSAQVRLLGLERFEVDAGDPLVVDATHRGGPFHLLAGVTEVPEEGDPVHRTLTAEVLDLPATARITVSPPCLSETAPDEAPCRADAGAFTYDGSGVIGSMTVDVVSSAPLVDEATHAQLRAVGFPTGLIGRFDADTETLTASLPDGALDLFELRVWTPGATVELPTGLQGVQVQDFTDTYAAFARLTGLSHATVSWGADRQVVDVAHDAGPFDLLIDTFDPDTGAPPRQIFGRLRDLPAVARFEYAPERQRACEPAELEPCVHPMAVVYRGDDEIRSMDVRVRGAEEVFGRAHDVHLLASDVPTELDLVVDSAAARATGAAPGASADFSLRLDACSLSCQPSGGSSDGNAPEDPDDGILLRDLEDRYLALLKITGLRHLDLGWGDEYSVDVTKAPGRFRIDAQRDLVHVVPQEAPEIGAPCGTVRDGIGELAPPGCDPCNPLTPDDLTAQFCPEAPEAPDPIRVPHRSTVRLLVPHLPERVDLTYRPADASITYSGSETIDHLEATVSDDRFAVLERSQSASLEVDGLPSDVGLRIEEANGGGMRVCAGTFDAAGTCQHGDPIGEVRLTALSHPDLQAEVDASPIYTQDRDGLLWIDLLQDDDGPLDPLADPFLLALRVRGLQEASFGVHDHVAAGVHHNRISADVARDNRTPLWVVLASPDLDKEPVDNEFGIVDRYRAAYVGIDVAHPPHRFAFMIDPQEDDWRRRIDLEYSATETSPQIDFDTNVGDMRILDIALHNLPAGEPAIDACISPNTMSCGIRQPLCWSGSWTCRPPEDCGQPEVRCEVVDLDGGSSELSLSAVLGPALHEGLPLELSGVFYAHDNLRVLFEPIRIDRGFTFTREVRSRDLEEGLIDSNVVFLHTYGGALSGQLRLRHINETDIGWNPLDWEIGDGEVDNFVWVELPGPGLTADQRWVEVEVEGVNEARNLGEASCPPGHVFEAEVKGVDLDVSDDLCRGRPSP
jgi:hypothetical protein